MIGDLWLIYALVFGAVLLAVQSIYVLFFKNRQERNTINRRLTLTSQLNNPNEVLEVLRRERGIAFIDRLEFLRGISTLIAQSGLKLQQPSLILMLGIIGVLIFVILSIATQSMFLAFAGAVPATVAALYLFLRIARARRIAAFSEQFPDAIDVIVRGLRAGHPFRVALGLVAREMPDPIGSEFGIVGDEIMFGLEQSRAIDSLFTRVGHRDLLFFSTAVNVQSQTGGNLAEILSRLSHLLRSRSKLRLKIRALSSEGRLSAIALSAAPFVLFGIITLISPEYFGAVRNHPIIPLAGGVALTMLAIGNFVMYRMVNFKF
jgi:tight adherence protein B